MRANESPVMQAKNLRDPVDVPPVGGRAVQLERGWLFSDALITGGVVGAVTVARQMGHYVGGTGIDLAKNFLK